MPKMTVLEIVQDILSDMESDEVNSITDTVEALEVAQIVKSTYYNMIDGRDWPHLYKFFQLYSSGDSLKPTHMLLPEEVSLVTWIKYNSVTLGDVADKYLKIAFKTPEEFIDILDGRDSLADNITVVIDDSLVRMSVFNDRAPIYYTSFDNQHIIFDAYDNTVDTIMQAAKTQCYGRSDPAWSMSDSFIPDLPANSFSYLLNDAKSTCFMVLKQAPHQKAEQNAVTQRRRMSQEAWRLNGGVKYPNYGRKR